MDEEEGIRVLIVLILNQGAGHTMFILCFLDIFV